MFNKQKIKELEIKQKELERKQKESIKEIDIMQSSMKRISRYNDECLLLYEKMKQINVTELQKNVNAIDEMCLRVFTELIKESVKHDVMTEKTIKKILASMQEEYDMKDINRVVDRIDFPDEKLKKIINEEINKVVNKQKIKLTTKKKEVKKK